MVFLTISDFMSRKSESTLLDRLLDSCESLSSFNTAASISPLVSSECCFYFSVEKAHLPADRNSFHFHRP